MISHFFFQVIIRHFWQHMYTCVLEGPMQISQEAGEHRPLSLGLGAHKPVFTSQVLEARCLSLHLPVLTRGWNLGGHGALCTGHWSLRGLTRNGDHALHPPCVLRAGLVRCPLG